MRFWLESASGFGMAGMEQPACAGAGWLGETGVAATVAWPSANSPLEWLEASAAGADGELILAPFETVVEDQNLISPGDGFGTWALHGIAGIRMVSEC